MRRGFAHIRLMVRRMFIWPKGEEGLLGGLACGSRRPGLGTCTERLAEV